jgi:hypothetical protein
MWSRKEDLGQMHVAVPVFFNAFFIGVAGLGTAAQAIFDKCKEGETPFYEKDCWRDWPEVAKERDLLSWFAPHTGRLSGLVDDESAGVDSRHRRSRILVPGVPND